MLYCWFDGLQFDNGSTYTYSHYGTLIGSYALRVKRNHRPVDPMTKRAQSRTFVLLSSALNGDAANPESATMRRRRGRSVDPGT